MIYIERRKKRDTSKSRGQEEKICFWLRLIKHTSRKKRRNKAKHAHNAYIRKKIQAKKKEDM
jgi:hypothetical protein